MNRAYGLTAGNLLRALPEALKQDESIAALAAAIADVLAARPDEIENLRIYSRIDQLPEPLLDILAHDFKVDWWNADYSIGAKRALLKDSWDVHRKLGTRYAVEQAISDIYPNTVIQEWWEYGGEPYCFRITIGSFDGAADAQKLQKIRRSIYQVKRLSAHLDGIDISSAVLRGDCYAGGALLPAVTELAVPARRDQPRFETDLTAGGAWSGLTVTPMLEVRRNTSFRWQWHGGGSFACVSTLRLPALADSGKLRRAVQIGGGAFHISETEVSHL